MKRFGGYLSVLGAVTILLIACQSQQQNIIRIGAAGPMTGDQSKMGIDLRNSVELAVAEWNRAGRGPRQKDRNARWRRPGRSQTGRFRCQQVHQPEGRCGRWTLEFELFDPHIEVLQRCEHGHDQPGNDKPAIHAPGVQKGLSRVRHRRPAGSYRSSVRSEDPAPEEDRRDPRQNGLWTGPRGLLSEGPRGTARR